MAAAKDRETNQSEMEHDDDDDLDEEPGEVIESAPPFKVGEERLLNPSGIRKKLLKRGRGWDTPEPTDEVTVHYVGTLLDGTKFDSTRDRDTPFSFKLGEGNVVSGLEQAIITMKKGESALFTLPPELGYGAQGAAPGIPPNSGIMFEVELLYWISVVDVCKDGGIVKKILEKGNSDAQPGDLDEVLVKYQAALVDGTIVARTLEQGVEFYVKDGHFCPAIPKTIKTMKRGERVNLIVQPEYALGEEGRGENEFPSIPPNSVLSIDLELVAFKPVIDISGDSKVLKKILKEGEGTVTASEGATVTIKYMAKLEDGTIVEKKGFDGEDPFQFITDEDQVIAGLDRAAATMKKGELAMLTIHPDYGFGNTEVNREFAVVPPSSTLVYEVDMLDLIKERALWEMNDHEKLEAAIQKKEEGNLLFKGGNFQRAVKKYDQAAEYVGEDASFWGDDENKTRAKALRVSCWLNAAACGLKLNNFREAIELCSKVLDIEFHNVKALYRRAQAYMETSDLYLAELDIKKAQETDPQNREVKLMRKNLKELQAESNKRDSKLYKNMFAHVAKDSSVPTKKFKASTLDEGKADEASSCRERNSRQPWHGG